MRRIKKKGMFSEYVMNQAINQKPQETEPLLFKEKSKNISSSIKNEAQRLSRNIHTRTSNKRSRLSQESAISKSSARSALARTPEPARTRHQSDMETPSRSCRKHPEESSRFTPHKMNMGVEIKQPSSAATQAEDLVLTNILARLSQACATCPDSTENTELLRILAHQKRQEQQIDEIVRETEKVREQNKCLEKESSRLKVENHQLIEHSKSLIDEINRLQLENQKIQEILSEESERVKNTIRNFTSAEKEHERTRKEKDKLATDFQRCYNSLHNSVYMIKSLLSTFVKTLNLIFYSENIGVSKIHTENSNQINWEKSFEELKYLLHYKIKALGAAVPDLDIRTELYTIESWDIGRLSTAFEHTEPCSDAVTDLPKAQNTSFRNLTRCISEKENDCNKSESSILANHLPLGCPPERASLSSIHISNKGAESLRSLSKSSYTAGEFDCAIKYPQYVAKHAFVGQKEHDLSFEKGALLYIEQKRKNGWWIGIYQGKRGYVPHNYLEEVQGI